jgi:hypothetical protein
MVVKLVQLLAKPGVTEVTLSEKVTDSIDLHFSNNLLAVTLFVIVRFFTSISYPL